MSAASAEAAASTIKAVVARKSFFIMDPLVRSCINFHEPLHQCFPRQQLELPQTQAKARHRGTWLGCTFFDATALCPHGDLQFYAPVISAKVLPKRAGEAATLMPAPSMAAILLSASPEPPEIMAPAWPMRRPGGAVRPAMNPTMGFFRPRLASSAMN